MMFLLNSTHHRDSYPSGTIPSRREPVLSISEGALRMTTSLKLSLRGARKGGEAIFSLRRVLRAYGARNAK